MDKKKSFFKERLLAWFEEEGRDFPWRDKGANPYHMLVGEIMLQKTRAENIVKTYKSFLEKYPDPESLANADIEEIRDLVKPLGLYKRRGKTLKVLGEHITSDGIPKSREELKSIHGIGKYITNAYLSIALGKPEPIVDTNVKRIYSRFFSLEVKKDPRRDSEIWKFVKDTLPKEEGKNFNLALLDFGAKVCRKKEPTCEICPLREKCALSTKTR